MGRLLEAKAKMFDSGTGFDWATAEALAFGSLQLEGYPVRLAGQDSTRGTFSQRHSGLINQETEERYFPLNNIRKGQAQYEVIDSMLSEYAVLGFEYGFSLAEPNALTLWEAQFGDFANGAQIMFDQFISSGRKQVAAHVGPRLPAAAWLRGAGPRTLLGAAGTVPDHVRRRQLDRGELYHAGQLLPHPAPAAAPHLPQAAHPHDPQIAPAAQDGDQPDRGIHHRLVFHRVLWDDAQYGNSKTELKPDDQIRRVVLCSGKVYYDLLEERDARGLDDVYLMRVEQFYPFPAISMVKEMERFKQAEMVWCQEEPKNQGAWSFIEPNIEWVLTRLKARHNAPEYAGRPAAASPATGLAATQGSNKKRWWMPR